MPRLPEQALRDLLVDALESGAHAFVLPASIAGWFPVDIQAAPGGPTTRHEIAVRTITRDTRQAGEWVDRMKIQLTGLAGVAQLDGIFGLAVVGEETIVVAIEPQRHLPVTGRSNNVQFPEWLLAEAKDVGGVVRHTKGNGEVVTAFPATFLVEHLVTVGGRPPVVVAPPPPRYTTARRRVRSAGFPRTIMDMFGHRCVACGVTLGIPEAAHIVPHALSLDDSPENGLCLCPNHHAAFDVKDLITFDEDRVVWLNTAQMDHLRGRGHYDGAQLLLGSLTPTILPAPAGVVQRDRLARRFELDRQEGAWERRDRVPI